jgi:hypothetical protein
LEGVPATRMEALVTGSVTPVHAAAPAESAKLTPAMQAAQSLPAVPTGHSVHVSWPVGATPAAALAAHMMVAVCAAYPAPHFTEHVASVWVFSTRPAVQPSLPSPATTPAAK